MLFNRKILKQLMNDAYKSTGLIVAIKDEILHMEAAHWIIEMQMDFVANDTIGELIKLVRTLPGDGEYVKVKKEKSSMEEEITLRWIDDEGIKTAQELAISPVKVISTGYEEMRLLQDLDTGEIYAVNDVWANIVDKREVDFDNGEYWVNMPVFNGVKMFWNNQTCKLMSYLRSDDIVDKIVESLNGACIVDGSDGAAIPEEEE